MKINKNIFLILICTLFINLVHTQNYPKVTVKSFTPKNNSYSIYYPVDFILEENEDGIVNIINNNSRDNEKENLNITISSYAFEKKLSESRTIEIMKNYFFEYFKLKIEEKDYASYKTE